MKKANYLLGLLLVGTVALSSCKKDCHDCHYDGTSGEVELGEFCGDELENIEKTGYTQDGVTYVVHCGEEH